MSGSSVMLTAEQFSQLATKDYLNKTLDEKLTHFATKDYLDEKLTHFATKDDLKNFATKDDLKNFATKDDLKELGDKLDLRFGQLDYKIESSFDNLNQRIDKVVTKLDRHEKDINDLNLFTVDHAMRIKKLEFRAF